MTKRHKPKPKRRPQQPVPLWRIRAAHRELAERRFANTYRRLLLQQLEPPPKEPPSE